MDINKKISTVVKEEFKGRGKVNKELREYLNVYLYYTFKRIYNDIILPYIYSLNIYEELTDRNITAGVYSIILKEKKDKIIEDFILEISKNIEADIEKIIYYVYEKYNGKKEDADLIVQNINYERIKNKIKNIIEEYLLD